MRRAVPLFLVLNSSLVFSETVELDSSWVRFNATNHTMFLSTRNLEDEGASPQLVRSETHLSAETDRYSASVILANRLAVASSDGWDVPFVLEKKFLAFENDHWRITLGDTHQELGRGIALALYRDEVLGFDNSVEGASVRFSPEGWEMNVMGGRARALQAPVALIPFQSPLFGRGMGLGSVAVKRKWNNTQLGAHYLLTMNRPFDQSDFDKRWHTAGLTLSADSFVPAWDAYLETNAMVGQRLLPVQESLSPAYGSFAALIYSPVPWKLKIETKDYRNYAYDFHRPPTMEEDIVTSLNFQDVTAARLWAERRLGVYNMVRASLLMGEDRTVQTSIAHGVVSGKWQTPGHLCIESRLGHRTLFGQTNLWHGDIKTKIPIRHGQALELGYRKLHGYTSLNFLPALDDRNFFDLAYTFSAHWSFNLGFEYVPSNSAAVGQTFYNAGTLVKFDAFTSRAFVGSTSGGPQCSGGICRQIPPYSGLMVEGTYAF